MMAVALPFTFRLMATLIYQWNCVREILHKYVSQAEYKIVVAQVHVLIITYITMVPLLARLT
jgi:hypothetical protein